MEELTPSEVNTLRVTNKEKGKPKPVHTPRDHSLYIPTPKQGRGVHPYEPRYPNYTHINLRLRPTHLQKATNMHQRHSYYNTWPWQEALFGTKN